MRTIAIINQKGGCGKTTTSINLAAVLALRGHRTLLVDMDPQSHCALGLAVPEDQIERSTADLMRHGLDGSISLDDITWQISRGLDLAPSAMALAGLEQTLAAAPDKDRRLAQVLSPGQDRYDYCIIDCPPSIGLLTFNALRAADEVLIPVETGYFALQGSVRQERTIELLVRRVGHRVRFRVLPTMYDVRTKLAREILGELKKHFGDRVLPMVINFNSKLKEAASFGQPISEYDSASRGMQDFEQLATWLQEHPPHAPEVFAVPAEAGAVAPVAADVNPSGGAATPAAPVVTRSTPPALSRAAELVERARALSAHAAATAARLPEVDRVLDDAPPGAAAEADRWRDNGGDDPIRTAPTPQPEPVLVAEASGHGSAASPSTLVLAEPPAGLTPPRRPDPAHLQARLDKVYGVRTTSRGVLFVQPAKTRGQFAIAGDFNNWNPSQTPMRRDDDLGVYQACVQIPVGRYRYRLVRDGQWVQDPFNPTVESNPFGELNNIVEVA